jgi:hypothetical protein
VYAEVVEHLGGDAVVARVLWQAKGQARLYGVESLLLERVGGDLVSEPDAASLLPQVEENAAPLLAQEPHALFELLTAIAAPRAEDVSGQILRVQSDQDRLVFANDSRLETGG